MSKKNNCPFCGLAKNSHRETVGHGMFVERWSCGTSDDLGGIRRGSACIEITTLKTLIEELSEHEGAEGFSEGVWPRIKLALGQR